MAKKRGGKRPAKRPAAKAAAQAQTLGKWTRKTELAQHYGASRNAVDKWTSRPDFPGGRRGPWMQAEVDTWLQQIRSPAAPGLDDNAAECDRRQLAEKRLRAEIAKLLEEVRAKQLRNNVLEGRLGEREEYERSAAELCGRIRLRLEAIPGEMQMLFPRELQVELTAEVRAKIHLILTEMAAWVL